MPAPPTRAALLGGISRFQGVTVTTQQFGTFNAFGPEAIGLALPADRQAYYAAQAAAGTTVIQMGWAGETYSEPDFTFPVPGTGMKWVDDLDGYLDLLAEPLLTGSFIGGIIGLPGDGFTRPDYPYGLEFLRANIDRLVTGMRNYRLGDLTKLYILLLGYDGVVWTWEGDDVVAMGHQIRAVAPDAYIAILYPAGVDGVYGEGKSPQYTDPAKLAVFDAFLQQFGLPPLALENLPQEQQIGARLLGPKYVVPPDQLPDKPLPFGPDSPNFLLSMGTPRGPWFTRPWEGFTYLWVRNRCTLADIEQWRQYNDALGWGPCMG